LPNKVVCRDSPRNFRTYAAIEASNAVLIPGAALLLAPPTRPAEWVSVSLAIAACAGFLLLGASYWAALDRRLRASDRRSLNRVLFLADRLELPLLLAVAAALIALIFGVLIHGFRWPLGAAGILTLLAVLEYVNYYHRQLQHFDRWSDFKRLVLTRRLPASHMAKDLAAYRRSKQATLCREGKEPVPSPASR
jgi:hypothetical protein